MSKSGLPTGKDLPLPARDRYHCRDDASLVQRIGALEKDHERDPGDVAILAELLRLNVITGRRPTHVRPLLKRLKKLVPDQAQVYKYSAIYNVNSFFQYKTALKDMRAYLELHPEDAFGYNFAGFLHYRLGDYQASIESLQRAIDIQPDNVYAYSLLARDHPLLLRKAKPDSHRQYHREQALAMLQEAIAAPTANAQRVARLRKWLDGRLD